jgi:SAM-dependent methyltransferase
MEVNSLQQTSLQRTSRRLRLLVVAASYGEKNIESLKRIIRNYQSMEMEVAIIVVSEAPKDLGSNVKVLVGLPSRNPWSLPFAHKRVFAENLDRYDLFVYTEDDIEVTQRHLQTFLRVTPELKSDEIAGFLRYEIDQFGTRSFPEAHGCYHWKADSVAQRGPYTVAQFTNEHAGFYILNQAQLRRAINSGGFLQAPYEGQYGLPETAATDPYTRCGFRKVICLSLLEDFLIHHMSNAYAGRLGLPLSAFQDQIQALIEISAGLHPACSLGQSESKLSRNRWSKSYYEKPSDELLTTVPIESKRILSVGSGFGDTELALQNRGAEVTALPLDSVIGAALAKRGIEVVFGSLDQCLQSLGSRTFDCVLISNLLHLFPEPRRILDRLQRFVRAEGTIVVTGPNFDFYKIIIKRLLRRGDLGRLGDFDRSGIRLCRPGASRNVLVGRGFSVEAVRWFNASSEHSRASRNGATFGRWTAADWGMVARRRSPSPGRFESENVSGKTPMTSDGPVPASTVE